MSKDSKFKTFLIGSANLLAVCAVASFLVHACSGEGTSQVTGSSSVVESPIIEGSFLEAVRKQRRQATASKADVLLGNHRLLMMGKGKGMMKKGKMDMGSSSKGKGKGSSDEVDCIPLSPTPAPTKGKGKGKGKGGGGMMMMMKGRDLKMSSSSSSKGSKGYYWHASPAPSFFCPEPFLDIAIEWTATATGLLNDGGWVITNNGNTIRFVMEDSSDGFCASNNPNEQTGSATATFTLDQAARLTATVSGLGEPFDPGNEVMTVFLDGNEIAQGQNAQGDIQESCATVITEDCCASVPIDSGSSPIVLEPGTYTISIDFSTFDGAYHVGAFFQTDLVFVPV